MHPNIDNFSIFESTTLFILCSAETIAEAVGQLCFCLLGFLICKFHHFSVLHSRPAPPMDSSAPSSLFDNPDPRICLTLTKGLHNVRVYVRGVGSCTKGRNWEIRLIREMNGPRHPPATLFPSIMSYYHPAKLCDTAPAFRQV